jgi:hypothetical protein
MYLKHVTLAVILSLTLSACCSAPATQTLDSSFIANVTAQTTPNQITVLYGSQTLNLVFDIATTFEVGQKLYVQGQLAGTSVKVNSVTKLN